MIEPAHKTIVIVKVTNIFGDLAPGKTYSYTYKSRSYEQARAMIWRALKRDHPDENPMEWEVQA